MAGSFWGKECVQYPVQVACQLPEVLDQVQVGAKVWIDEGKPGTLVEAIVPEKLLLSVTGATHSLFPK